MEPKEAALLSSILHLPAGISVLSAHPSATGLVVRIACQTPSMPCPECQQLSTHLHGMYQRTIADLPCAGRDVLLILRVRKFFCRTPTCSHKIFAERLPGLVESYGRMTTRLIALLQALGLGAGGQMGARQAERSGIATTPSTLLRQVMRLPVPVTRAVRVLGVDDWSWKKRHRYDTLLVDLERHKIIDILADRESATLEWWLSDHPEVEIVSRDRGKDYAKAVTRGAPQARQVVDRFHLVRNLSVVLQRSLAHCRAELRKPDAERLLPAREAEVPDRPLPTPTTWQQRTPPHIEIAHQVRQASREDRFRQMTALRAHGLTQVEIAKRMGMSERAGSSEVLPPPGSAGFVSAAFSTPTRRMCSNGGRREFTKANNFMRKFERKDFLGRFASSSGLCKHWSMS